MIFFMVFPAMFGVKKVEDVMRWIEWFDRLKDLSDGSGWVDHSLSTMLDSSPVSSIDIFLHGVSFAVDTICEDSGEIVRLF